MHPQSVRELADAVLAGPGETPVELRLAVEAWVAGRSGGVRQASEIPAELERYLRKVSLHAYEVTDADIDDLKAHGYSEDQIFEITVSAALGAGLARLERTLDLLVEIRS